jgi:hypothetical protein
VRKGHDYCSAHSGLGIATDPASWGKQGIAARKEKAQRRAALRLVLGERSLGTVKGALRFQAAERAGEIAARTVGAILDPATSPERAARLALDLAEVIEPNSELTLHATLPESAEAVESLSLEELVAIAQQHGIQVPEPDGTEPGLAAGGVASPEIARAAPGPAPRP